MLFVLQVSAFCYTLAQEYSTESGKYPNAFHVLLLFKRHDLQVISVIAKSCFCQWHYVVVSVCSRQSNNIVVAVQIGVHEAFPIQGNVIRENARLVYGDTEASADNCMATFMSHIIPPLTQHAAVVSVSFVPSAARFPDSGSSN